MNPKVRLLISGAVQIAATILLISIGVYLADDSRTPLHAIWLFGIPLVIASIANRSLKARVIAAMVLIMCALVSGSLMGELLGQGP